MDLNAATELDLADYLPGIGEVKAKAIVTYREKQGGFRGVRDLLNVPGIGEKTLERIEPLVFVKNAALEPPGPAPLTSLNAPLTRLDAPLTSPAAPLASPPAPATTPNAALPPSIRPSDSPREVVLPADKWVNINTASVEQLETLYNIGPARAEAIVAYRKQHGPFLRIEDLDKVPGIGPKTLEKNRARLRVR